MKARVERQLSGYTLDQLFSIAANFEAYPRFLPLCRAMRVLERHGPGTDGQEILKVDNVFGLSGARVRFLSEATFIPPTAIDIVSTDGPFERLDIAWRFNEIDPSECSVSFEISPRFRSGVLAEVSALFSKTLKEKTIDAFAAEARKRFGS